MVPPTLFCKCCKTNGLSNLVCGKIGKLLILKYYYIWINYKMNGSSNINFGNNVKPIILALIFVELMYNQRF